MFFLKQAVQFNMEKVIPVHPTVGELAVRGQFEIQVLTIQQTLYLLDIERPPNKNIQITGGIYCT
jgi:hypothetical protein